MIVSLIRQCEIKDEAKLVLLSLLFIICLFVEFMRFNIYAAKLKI